MSFRKLIVILSFFCFYPLFSNQDLEEARNPAQTLSFQQGSSANQIFETLVESETEFPGFTLNQSVKQKIFAQVTLVSTEQRHGVSQPKELEVVITRISAEVRGNGETTTFDTDDEKTSLEFGQLREILHRPFLIQVSENFALEDSDAVAILAKEFPLIEKVLPERLFAELFQYQFFLCGRELIGGEKFLSSDDLKVDINRANKKEVQATFGGRLKSRRLALSPEDKLQVEGIVKGTGSWQSENALLYRVKVHQSLSGLIRKGEEVASVTMKVTHWVDSQERQPEELSHFLN